ncbi:hypothetical protein [Pseudodesulfovibrio sp.]|uniref:hypothetical protein n=1 Tax=unclassified Pseudodesulfovibrio TaxID=2661612 RepID=UPI003AFF7B9F
MAAARAATINEQRFITFFSCVVCFPQGWRAPDPGENWQDFRAASAAPKRFRNCLNDRLAQGFQNRQLAVLVYSFGNGCVKLGFACVTCAGSSGRKGEEGVFVSGMTLPNFGRKKGHPQDGGPFMAGWDVIGYLP